MPEDDHFDRKVSAPGRRRSRRAMDGITSEDEYFARREAERRAALAARLKAEREAREREERRKLHHHRCGKCGAPMETRIFRGVEIEVCPECGAVLLDPGELEILAGKDHSGLLGDFLGLFGHGSRG